MREAWPRVVERVAASVGGKRTREAVYLHRSAVRRLDAPLATMLRNADALASSPHWNIAKFWRHRPGVVSLLDYPGFETEETPALASSTLVDVAARRTRRSVYCEHRDCNRAVDAWILHRKEETLALDDQRRAAMELATARLQRSGAFDPATRHLIGRRSAWERVVERKRNGLVCVPDKTAIRQVPALLRALQREGELPRGSVNADIGGGPYPDATAFLRARGVTNIVYDCVLSAKDQEKALRALRAGRADSATLANVLNVIESAEVRRGVVELAASSVRRGGRVWVAVHDGDRSGRGGATSRGWQNNRPVSDYLDEVKRVLPSARLVTIGSVRAIVAEV